VWNQALPPARVAQLGASRGTAAGTAPYAAWLLP
jgi:hypothetical protein